MHAVSRSRWARPTRVQHGNRNIRRAVLRAVASPQQQDIIVPPKTIHTLDDAKAFLETELRRVFVTGVFQRTKYADKMSFEDPIAKLNTFTGYQTNLRLLRTLCKVDFVLHSVDTYSEDKLVARWTMLLKAQLLPWQPAVMVTGRSFYQVSLDTGRIIGHTDKWDSVQNSGFLSPEALQYVLKELVDSSMMRTPDIETPKYTVLYKTSVYEVRQYDPYLVAETPMPTANPASGSSFNELAGYIFGGNSTATKMEMTTPVFTTAEPSDTASRMQFVIESKLGDDPAALPSPNDTRVATKREAGGLVASIRFPGLALGWEVVEQEKALRDALLKDGLSPMEGFQLARYNEPFVLPPFRRNEVLIKLDGFTWPTGL